MQPSLPSPVEDLFQTVLDTDDRSAREALLAGATSELVQARVRELLRIHEATDPSEAEVVPRPSILPPEREPHPDRIGDFAIQSVLAEGAASIVYLARQDRPSRPVALKVVRPSLATSNAAARCAREAELLGQIAHPSIATIHAAGIASATFSDTQIAERVYIAMEYVDGPSLTVYADSASLTVSQRVLLLARVADAVHAAHQQGVIHRDLKPSNILVTREGEPKVLDFGAAEFVEHLRSAARAAHAPILMGTGPYLSPEHVECDPLQVDTRSDIYSLGVILYELLAGAPPLDLAGLPMHEVVRRIQTIDPRPIRERVPGLAGDLALIVHRAIARSKLDRYQSCGELAADLRRFLAKEPVAAHPPGALYELRMFARRRTGLVGGVLTAAALLVAASTIAVREASAARELAHARALALEQADAARDEAETAVEFLQTMLASPNPAVLNRDVRVREVLDQATRTLDEKFHNRPAARARVSETLGRTYFELGELDAALPLLQSAYALRTSLNGPSHPATAGAAMALAAVLGVHGEHDQAAQLYTQAINVLSRTRGRTSTDCIEAIAGLASVELDRQRFDAAIALDREAVALARSRGTPLTASDYRTLTSCAEALQWSGKTGEAITMYYEAIPGLERALGVDHPWTLNAANGLAQAFHAIGKKEEALALYRRVYDARCRVLGPRHGDTLGAANNLAIMLLATGRPAEARTVFENILGPARDVLGKDHRNTLKTEFNIAQTYVEEKRYAEAKAILEPLLAVQRTAIGPDHIDIIDSLQVLGTIALGQDDPLLADTHLSEALAIAKRIFPGGHHNVDLFRMTRARALVLLNRPGEAKTELNALVESFLAFTPSDTTHAAEALTLLESIYITEGDTINASNTRTRLTTLATPH